MFSFTKNYPLPDFSLYGVYRKFKRITLELTSLCNNNCSFCLRQIDKDFSFGSMSMADLFVILQRIPDFDGFVSLNLNGESFLLDNLPEYCRTIKEHWPKSDLGMISTFNIDRGPQFIKRLFSSGLRHLAISCYGHTRDDYAKIHGNDAFLQLENNIRYLKTIPVTEGRHVQIDLLNNTESLFGISDAEVKKQRFLAFAREHGIRHCQSKKLHGWGRESAAAPMALSKHYPCSIVWGGRASRLDICWNLNVVPCCFLSGQQVVLGNLHDATPQEIFSSATYRMFYDKHWAGDVKDIPVCKSCDYPNHYASPDETTRLAAWQGQRLSGKNAYFWGGGETYRRYKTFFSALRPQAILLDNANELPCFIDDIPVRRPDEVLAGEGEPLPLIIFATPQNNARILATLHTRYPRYAARADYVLSVADAGRNDVGAIMKIEQYLAGGNRRKGLE